MMILRLKKKELGVINLRKEEAGLNTEDSLIVRINLMEKVLKYSQTVVYMKDIFKKDKHKV